VVTRLISGGGAAILLLLTLACGSTSVSQITGPDPVRCQASVATVPTIPAGGGRVDVSVVTNRECSWSAASNSSWIQVSPTAGQGEASITLTATANPQGVARNGNFAVNGSQFAVTQAASPCTFALNPADIDAPASGGRIITNLQTLAGCAWTASSPVAWAVLEGRTGTGPGNVAVGVEPNQATTARKVDILIADRVFTITQSGVAAPAPSPAPAPAPAPGPTPAPAPPPAPQACSYLIDPITRMVKEDGGDKTVKVNTGSTCTWTATSNVSWIAITNNAQGTGTRDVKYEVAKNESSLPRTGTITVAGLTHIVIQEGHD
jgi:hypothetical protein